MLADLNVNYAVGAANVVKRSPEIRIETLMKAINSATRIFVIDPPTNAWTLSIAGDFDPAVESLSFAAMKLNRVPTPEVDWVRTIVNGSDLGIAADAATARTVFADSLTVILVNDPTYSATVQKIGDLINPSQPEARPFSSLQFVTQNPVPTTLIRNTVTATALWVVPRRDGR